MTEQTTRRVDPQDEVQPSADLTPAWSRVPEDTITRVLDFLPLAGLPTIAVLSQDYSRLLEKPEIWTKFLPVEGAGQRPLFGNTRAAVRELLKSRQAYLQRDCWIGKSSLSLPICASSTDQGSQTIYEALDYARESTFWSSTGSESPEASEHVVYRLSGAVGLLSSVEIAFFEAYFQPGRPLYNPRKVRILVGWWPEESGLEAELQKRKDRRQSAAQFKGDEPEVKRLVDMVQWHYESPLFEVKSSKDPQVFHLPRLVPGCLMRVDMIGKVATQPSDMQFYTCIQSIVTRGQSLSDLPDGHAKDTVAQIVMDTPGFPQYAKDVLKVEGIKESCEGIPVDLDTRWLGHKSARDVEKAYPGCVTDPDELERIMRRERAKREFSAALHSFVERYGQDFGRANRGGGDPEWQPRFEELRRLREAMDFDE